MRESIADAIPHRKRRKQNRENKFLTTFPVRSSIIVVTEFVITE